MPVPFHALNQQPSHAAHLLRLEFATVSADLQGAFEVPTPLLRARIAERRLDAHAKPKVLDGLQILEPSERLDGQREVVRVLVAGDLGESYPFPRRELRGSLAK